MRAKYYLIFMGFVSQTDCLSDHNVQYFKWKRISFMSNFVLIRAFFIQLEYLFEVILIRLLFDVNLMPLEWSVNLNVHFSKVGYNSGEFFKRLQTRISTF